MTTKPRHSEADKTTHEAWKRLQEQLAAEPVNAKWETWGSAGKENGSKLADMIAAPAASAAVHDSSPQLKVEAPAPVKSSRRRAGKGRKWAAAAAAVVIFGTVLATPMGNNALAAILHQFKVQEITRVDGDSLENMFNQMVPGESASKDNMFGQFSTESGNVQGEFTREQAVSKLPEYQLLSPDLTGSKETVYITPSRTITMKLNVDELNQAMQRVGATELLPDTMDGKEVTFSMHESIIYDLGSDEQQWASLTQQQAPEIMVDPSVDVKEAVDAVLQLPILPSDLKEQLQRSGILSGSIPMPYVVGQDAKANEITLGGTKVLVEQRQYDTVTDRTAIWIKDGQLFYFEGGSAYETEAEFMNKLKELVGA
ncbi:hypothetical protein OIN60_11035 [Paenibacillus sp. P96]|uniref:DUF4367 domain-containing protein n=1 Tax=Paenibacillus zeirhizosphaerae TaxID=2987519 RepID=A0ABT9FRE5_9BACL|nr:hypothetical protein [Paenibacillus sp. P96]MDP4097305.1 hypothetical protein [Paenibacillus sp. P96]